MIEILAKYSSLNTNQRPADQTRIVLKKDWFSYLEILEIYRQIVKNMKKIP